MLAALTLGRLAGGLGPPLKPGRRWTTVGSQARGLALEGSLPDTVAVSSSSTPVTSMATIVALPPAASAATGCPRGSRGIGQDHVKASVEAA